MSHHWKQPKFGYFGESLNDITTFCLSNYKVKTTCSNKISYLFYLVYYEVPYLSSSNAEKNLTYSKKGLLFQCIEILFAIYIMLNLLMWWYYNFVYCNCKYTKIPIINIFFQFHTPIMIFFSQDLEFCQKIEILYFWFLFVVPCGCGFLVVAVSFFLHV